METGLSDNGSLRTGREERIPVIRLFRKMMLYKPGLYLVNCILWAAIHVAPLLLGLIIKEFFNILSNNRHFGFNLMSLIAVTTIYALGRMINIYAGAWADIYHRFTMSALLRRNMLASILEKPGADSVKTTSGEALNCFRDDAETIENSISWTLDFIGNVIFVIVAIIIMLNINVQITIFVFTPLVFVVGIVQLLSTKLKNYRKAAREATGIVTGAMGEIFGAVQAIKVAGEEEHVIDYLDGLNKKRHRMMLKDTLLTQTLDAVFYNTVSLGTGFILLLAAGIMKNGNMTIGELTLFLYYLNFISDFTSFFGWFIANNRQAKVSFSRIAALMQENSPAKAVQHHPIPFFGKERFPASRKQDPDSKTGPMECLEIKDLSYHYPSSGNGIDDVSFTVKKGSFTVITGRIGSGKSTLLKAMTGLLSSERGEILWNGRKVDYPADFFVAPISAYTPQIPNLFSESIKNNILLGLPEEADDLNKAIHSAVLEQDISELENGLDTIIGPKGVKLSGGQIQRVAAARMFIRNPQLMVFDDISSALDVETENILWSRLYENRRTACLVVSNRRAALKHADQIIVMKDGKIYAKGRLEELLGQCDELQKIWG